MEEKQKKRLLLVSGDKKAYHFIYQLLSGEEGYEFNRASSQDKPVDAVQSLKPALVLLHLDEFKQDSLAVLSRIIIKCATPVVILYNGDEKSVTIMKRGLRLGAADALKIPDSISETLASKVMRDRLMKVISESIAGSQKAQAAPSPFGASAPADSGDTAQKPIERAATAKVEIVGIAISTGGPNALSVLLPLIPENFPTPIAVVQHIIPGFISNVAVRLNANCRLNVKIAENGERLNRGTIYFAPDGLHLKIKKESGRLLASLSPEPDNLLFRPSADVLFSSMVDACGGDCVGVIMTGMGKDGVQGLRRIKSAGGLTIAQDQDSSAIYGMARVAVEENLIDHVLRLEEIAKEIHHLSGGVIIEEPKIQEAIQ